MTIRTRVIMVAGAALIGASPVVIDHLTQWESGGKRVLTVYADRVAGGLPTVCNGITRHVTTEPVIVGQTWTTEKCERVEQAALESVQTRLAGCFRVPVPQSVFDMATSHSWNFGVHSTCGSSAMQAWNIGELELGCRRIAFSDLGKRVWSYACTGSGPSKECKLIRGLALRRDDEARKCASGI